MKAGILVLLAGLACGRCAPYQVFSSDLRSGVDQSFDFVRWRQLPKETPPTTIELGGRIIDAETKGGTTTVIAAQLPVVRYPAFGPKQAKSKGEFVITYRGPVSDPSFLHPGNRIMVLGNTAGTKVVPLDDIMRSLPNVEAICIHIWKTGDQDISDFASSGAGYGTLEEETSAGPYKTEDDLVRRNTPLPICLPYVRLRGEMSLEIGEALITCLLDISISSK